MAKISAKNAIVLIKGYNFSTYAIDYTATIFVDPIEVTGFSNGSHNFIPGQRAGDLTIGMLWDAATDKIHDALKGLGSGNITMLPEGYTAAGDPSLSMPYTQGNYDAQGALTEAIKVGSLHFASYGDNAGMESGWALYHGTITNTTTGTTVDDPTGGSVTAKCAGTIHVWAATTTDSYVVKIVHSSDGTTWYDLVTFTVNGQTVTSERVAVASGTIRLHRRVVATRTGAAGDSFGFTVHFYHA